MRKRKYTIVCCAINIIVMCLFVFYLCHCFSTSWISRVWIKILVLLATDAKFLINLIDKIDLDALCEVLKCIGFSGVVFSWLLQTVKDEECGIELSVLYDSYYRGYKFSFFAFCAWTAISIYLCELGYDNRFEKVVVFMQAVAMLANLGLMLYMSTDFVFSQTNRKKLAHKYLFQKVHSSWEEDLNQYTWLTTSCESLIEEATICPDWQIGDILDEDYPNNPYVWLFYNWNNDRKTAKCEKMDVSFVEYLIADVSEEKVCSVLSCLLCAELLLKKDYNRDLDGKLLVIWAARECGQYQLSQKRGDTKKTCSEFISDMINKIDAAFCYMSSVLNVKEDKDMIRYKQIAYLICMLVMMYLDDKGRPLIGRVVYEYRTAWLFDGELILEETDIEEHIASVRDFLLYIGRPLPQITNREKACIMECFGKKKSISGVG